jgi:hypothetical protein
MRLSIKIVSGDLANMMKAEGDHVAKAVKAAFQAAGEKIKKDGRASIAAGGFSSRWQNALRVSVKPTRIVVHHKIPYAGQFEDPEPVDGAPYIWLPIEANLPSGGKHFTPAMFTSQIGPLRGGRAGTRPLLFGQVSVSSRGKPLKLPRHGARSKPAQKKWMPVFVGVSAVNDPRRFDVTGAAENVAGQLAEIFGGKWESSDG